MQVLGPGIMLPKFFEPDRGTKLFFYNDRKCKKYEVSETSMAHKFIFNKIKQDQERKIYFGLLKFDFCYSSEPVCGGSFHMTPYSHK